MVKDTINYPLMAINGIINGKRAENNGIINGGSKKCHQLKIAIDTSLYMYNCLIHKIIITVCT